MKIKTIIIYIVAVPILALVALMGFRYIQHATFPSGPVTDSQMRSLTNVVKSVTAEPILHIDRTDIDPLCRMMVFTGSPTAPHSYLFERTRFGWKAVPMFSVKP